MERRREARERTNGGIRRGQLAAGGSALGMTALVAILLVAPSAAAATPGHTFGAPYKNSRATLSDPNSIAGGGSGVQVHPATWSKHTGIAAFSSNASATWWTNKTNSSASEIGQVVVAIPVHVKTTGFHNITALWITIAAGYANLTAGTCSAGSSP